LAVTVTLLFVGKEAEHTVPQSMPAGLLLTTPEPDPSFEMVKSDIGTAVNVAVTDRFTSITTEQLVPVQSPLHPAKIEPTPGVAVKATVVPGAKPALQVPGQDIPVGLLVTVPAPLIVTISVTGGAGVVIVKVAVTV
jgi:hypothetical protein